MDLTEESYIKQSQSTKAYSRRAFPTHALCCHVFHSRVLRAPGATNNVTNVTLHSAADSWDIELLCHWISVRFKLAMMQHCLIKMCMGLYILPRVAILQLSRCTYG